MSTIQYSIKIIVATLAALFLARALQLQYATVAGVIAILGVLDTRRSSFQMAARRALSTLLALALAWGIFTVLGFSMASLAFFVVLYVPLANANQLSIGIAPSTVLVIHLWTEQSVGLALLSNEIALFAIGTGFALLANSYMPSKDKLIATYHDKVEVALRDILLLFAQFLRQGDGRNEAKKIKQLDKLLEEALETVYHDRHNQVFRRTNYEVHYFEMRQQQVKSLTLIARHINRLQLSSQENNLLAQLFERTAKELSRHNPARDLLADIDSTLEQYRKRDLPKTRQEFETRALLFQLLHDLEHFLQLKADFYAHYDEDRI